MLRFFGSLVFRFFDWLVLSLRLPASQNQGMGPEHSSQPAMEAAPLASPAVPAELDQAVEAIVYDVHPALAQRDYPYGRPVTNSARDLDQPLTQLLEAASGGVASVIESMSRKPDYVVPRRFGMSAILGIMTALAAIFGALHWLSAEPVFYAFFAIQSLTICIAQMLHGQTPRKASIIAGAVILPLFTLIAANFSEQPVDGAFCLIIPFIPCGAVLGYLTGTCAAGIFLVMDKAEAYFKGESLDAPLHAPPSPAP